MPQFHAKTIRNCLCLRNGFPGNFVFGLSAEGLEHKFRKFSKSFEIFSKLSHQLGLVRCGM